MFKRNRVLLIIFFIFIFYLFVKNIQSSIFLKAKDRVSVVFYGSNTVFYSLGISDVSYFFTVSSDNEIQVPGGYGYYRVGALGKLVSLEKNNDLLRKVFSAASSSFVDLYFHPRGDVIYYSEKQSSKFIPSGRAIFMYNSNANFLDRLLLWLFFLQKPENQFKEITNLPQKTDNNRALFDNDEFFKEYQGFFYKKTYRMINDRVQILYTKNYKTALLISNILEGEGIQVVDLSQTDMSQKGCKIIYNTNKNMGDTTANDVKNFFGCSLMKGETGVSDIILVLGDLENSWNVE